MQKIRTQIIIFIPEIKMTADEQVASLATSHGKPDGHRELCMHRCIVLFTNSTHNTSVVSS